MLIGNRRYLECGEKEEMIVFRLVEISHVDSMNKKVDIQHALTRRLIRRSCLVVQVLASLTTTCAPAFVHALPPFLALPASQQ
jgi:hypothetical protein